MVDTVQAAFLCVSVSKGAGTSTDIPLKNTGSWSFADAKTKIGADNRAHWVKFPGIIFVDDCQLFWLTTMLGAVNHCIVFTVLCIVYSLMINACK